jgi:hypothetical protein
VVGQAAGAVVPWSPLQAVQVKLAVEHAGAAAVVQSAPVAHAPHVPADGPVVMQNGVAAGHGADASLSWLPLHPPHLFVATLQSWPVPQSESATHPPHRFIPTRAAVHTPPPYSEVPP